MRNLLKFSVSILLVFSLLFSVALVSMNVGAVEEGSLGVAVETVNAKAGDTVDVKIDITDNPGIIALKMNVEYDEDVLTLVGATDAGVLGGYLFDDSYTSPYILTWNEGDADKNNVSTGTIVTLHFEVADSAVAGTTEITVGIEDANDCLNYDLEAVSFEATVGGVTVKEEVVVGDLSGDNVLDSDDAVYLMKYTLYGAEEYPLNQSANFDGSGEVDFNDAVWLLYNTIFGSELYPLY